MDLGNGANRLTILEESKSGVDLSKIVEEQVATYRKNYLDHGDTPRGTFQNNPETMCLRYERLLLPFLPSATPLTIHDVGCGLCDLHAYLKSRNIDHHYSGTEIVPEMVEAAKNKYPGIEVFQRDILQDPVEDRYDVVLLSGVLNIPGRVPLEDWKPFCRELLRKMFGMARYGISFNFLATHTTFRDPSLCYLNPSEMLTFCLEELSRFVRVDHVYPLYETSISVFRPDFVRTLFDDPAFDKYFSHSAKGRS